MCQTLEHFTDRRYLSTFIAFVLLAQVVSASASAAENPTVSVGTTQSLNEEHGKTELMWELDPYYSNVSANIPLTSKPIPTINSGSESVILRELIKDSLIPRYLVLEASVNPMPVLGTYLKRQMPDLYNKGSIGNSGINVIESLTAGFQEPWAVSAFFGNIAKLNRPNEERMGVNMGYTGYLLSAGAKHIKDNVLIDDIWHELEWKIKGKRDYSDEKMSWSFRVGGKFNSNPDITDVYYLGLYRSNLDIKAPVLRWLENSNFDVKIQFSQRSGKAVREEFFIGKKFPIHNQRFTPTMDVGLVWESPDQYAGALRDRSDNSLTLLFRPSVVF
jgi:hypothetical protein